MFAARKLGRRDEHKEFSALLLPSLLPSLLPKLEFTHVKNLSLGFFIYKILIIVPDSQLFI